MSDEEHYSNLADALNVSREGIKDTINNFIKLFFLTKANHVRSDAISSNIVLFSYEEGEIVLTYITDSVSTEMKADILKTDKRINDNWYYFERK